MSLLPVFLFPSLSQKVLDADKNVFEVILQI
jgi:hypothetical protein